MRYMLEMKMAATLGLFPDRENAQVRREFREEQGQIYPDHLHLIEQAIQEMLPELILDELDQQSQGPEETKSPIQDTVIASDAEPRPAPEITNTLPVSEPVHETSAAPTTQQSSRDKAPAELPDVQEGLRRIQQAMTIAHSRGMTTDEVYPHVDNLMKKYEIKSLPTDFIRPLLDLWKEPEPEPQPQPLPVPTDTCSDEEEWISTWDLPLQDRLQRIVDFMEQDGRANYTRQQIEIGAGYRHPDDILDEKTYEKLTRRLQRDLELLMKDGDIVRTKKDNPKKKGGFKNKIWLYSLAPLQEPALDALDTKNAWATPKLRTCLTDALDAFDAHNLVKLKDYLTSALDALDAFDGQ
jgi:hypothetical protein